MINKGLIIFSTIIRLLFIDTLVLISKNNVKDNSDEHRIRRDKTDP